MKPKKDKRKSPQDVRSEKSVAVAARAARAEKTAAYDVAYKAAAVARREKLAAEGQAQA